MPLFSKSPVPYALSPHVTNERSLAAAVDAAAAFLNKVRILLLILVLNAWHRHDQLCWSEYSQWGVNTRSASAQAPIWQDHKMSVPSQAPKAVIIVGQQVKAYCAIDATVKLAEASQYATATIANAKVRLALHIMLPRGLCMHFGGGWMLASSIA